jgi:spore maturation protein CgeB
MPYRLLYIDAVYPYEWLQQKQKDVESLPFVQYREWLLSQRIYLSDYITSNLDTSHFECETLIVNDPLFITKLNSFLRGKKINRKKAGNIKRRLKEIADVSALKFYRYLKPSEQARRDRAVKKACEYFQPDIIFVREPSGIDTYFWNQFRNKSLVIGLIGCNTAHPTNWLSHNFDVLFSLTPEYQQFFKVQGIPSYLFSYGVDKRVFSQLSEIIEKKYDVSFVGLLGSDVQAAKTKLMETIASGFSFNWWGPWNVDENEFPNLFRSYKGTTSGIEMLTIYRQSKIVVNDYVDTANGKAVNLRLYEVLNSGSFLLTREAENLKQQFGDIVCMFNSEEDCIKKISWFLKHENERESKARSASAYALEHFSYTTQLREIGSILNKHHQIKFRPETHGTTLG